MKLDKPLHYKKALEIFKDDRGFLNATSFKNLLDKIKLSSFKIKYQLLSKTIDKHTFRGFHYQREPYWQNKIIILHSGKIKDYILPYSKPEKQNIQSFLLNAGDILVIPRTYAHGFITLSSDVIIQYIMDNEYIEKSYKGINGYQFVKKDLNLNEVIISKKDKNHKIKIL